MKNRVCPTTGKRIYKHANEAKKVVGRIPQRSEGLTGYPQTTYRCEHCRRWHLTSMSPAQSRWITQMKKVKTP